MKSVKGMMLNSKLDLFNWQGNNDITYADYYLPRNALTYERSELYEIVHREILTLTVL